MPEDSCGMNFPVVGIGASAGGIEALIELFKNMPIDSGMAFVVVTHQHADHSHLLPELLGKKTRMPVIEAQDGIRIKPNSIYVCPPNQTIAIVNTVLRNIKAKTAKASNLPIDYFFRSLAEDQKERAICIILSGMGTDGTLGMKAIKGESGMTMVQQPQSAKYAGMPASAINTGLVDYVLLPSAMPEQLIKYAEGLYISFAHGITKTSEIPIEVMRRIFILLRAHMGHDFSAYKANTIQRRIERRMHVHQINTPDEYINYLHENPHEIDILFKELLISVTNFFRDPEAWDSLHIYLEKLIESYPENYNFRIWVPGCATGEEAYSLAITLQEIIDKTHRHLNVQIFATDLDAEAINIARSGQYPQGIASDVPAKYLERYFVHKEGIYSIRKEIREMVIFAPQNMIQDPPFTKLDLLSCRNVLIYLNSELQKKLLPIFHYAIKPNGLLFLGPSETMGSFSELFKPIDKRWKIFRHKKCEKTFGILPSLSVHTKNEDGNVAAEATLSSSFIRESRLPITIERFLLKRFVPTSVIVNERGNILYIHGRTGPYLELAQGELRNNLLEMVREGLEVQLSSALRECCKKNIEIVRNHIRIKSNGDWTHINLHISKIQDSEILKGLLLVSFYPATSLAPPPPVPPLQESQEFSQDVVENKSNHQLERELQYIKESHQTTLEELEFSNSELKSTNEELQSTNEELQSINEELETSKEEMQSLNEELVTLNNELQLKVDELSQTNDDMQNLLNSTDIATVFLDNHLNIKRFTEQAKELIMLRSTDVGRPIFELVSNLIIDNLISDCQNVLKTLTFKEEEVKTRNGGCYLMKIIPYRTAENCIDGLVLTFVNIGPLRQVEQTIEYDLTYLENITSILHEPLLILDEKMHIVRANPSFYRTFCCTADQAEGKLIFQLQEGLWDTPAFHHLFEDILSKQNKFENYEIEIDISQQDRRWFAMNGQRIEQPKNLRSLVLLVFHNIMAH